MNTMTQSNTIDEEFTSMEIAFVLELQHSNI